MAPGIIRQYGFDVEHVRTLSGDEAQAFMTEFEAGPGLQAMTREVTFWRVLAVHREDQGVDVGDIMLTHTSNDGCLVRFVAVFTAHSLRDVIGAPL